MKPPRALARAAARAAMLQRMWEVCPGFVSLQDAKDFRRGYCVPRVVVRLAARRFVIVTPDVAKKHGLDVVAP